MSFVSSSIRRIRPSVTIAITARAAELRAAGEDVIALSAGEPDFDTPEHIREAAIAAINRGYTRYTAADGSPELKEAVARKFRRENGLDYDRKQISVANGGKQIIYNALVASLEPGDEVVIPAPYWVSYPEMTALCGGVARIVPTSAASEFLMTPEQLAGALTPKTRWVILNSPSNPSGAIYSREALQELGEVLLSWPRVLVMCDDMYEHIIHDGAFHTMAQVEPRLFGRTLTVNGVSKAFAMTGWRIGFAGGPAELIRGMGVVQSQSTANPCSISQAAAIAALDTPRDFLPGWLASFRERRDFVVSSLAATPGLSCAMPAGAFYVYPSCEGVIGKRTPSGREIASDGDFAAALLESGAVAVVHGEAFGLSPHFRVSYAASMRELTEACQRIRSFCLSLDQGVAPGGRPPE